MIVYSHAHVRVADICNYNNLDVSKVMEAICESDVSFGNNFDTLITQQQFQSILDNYFDGESVNVDWNGLNDSVLISLGS